MEGSGSGSIQNIENKLRIRIQEVQNIRFQIQNTDILLLSYRSGFHLRNNLHHVKIFRKFKDEAPDCLNDNREGCLRSKDKRALFKFLFKTDFLF
jgi:hypothetical protein